MIGFSRSAGISVRASSGRRSVSADPRYQTAYVPNKPPPDNLLRTIKFDGLKRYDNHSYAFTVLLSLTYVDQFRF